MAGIFDTHAHYDDEKFDEDREALLSTMQEKAIETIVNVGASMATCHKTLEIANRYSFIYGALGVHPCDVDELTEADMEWIAAQSRNDKIVAVGEIGLDYYRDDVDRNVQKKWFVRQMQLAREIKLPIIIHSRDAAADTYDIMKAEHAEEIGGVVHCYSYTKEMARQFLEMDFYFGLGGVLTFSNAKKVKEAAEYIPMDRIVLETDCPYLAPTPNRGKRNSSLNLPYVVQELARIKGLSEQGIIDITNRNAHALYRM